jgi:hypothetical protein
MAERVGFEPTVELPPLRFSRPACSAAPAPLRRLSFSLYGVTPGGAIVLRSREHLPVFPVVQRQRAAGCFGDLPAEDQPFGAAGCVHTRL